MSKPDGKRGPSQTSFFPIQVYFWGDRHRDLFLGAGAGERVTPFEALRAITADAGWQNFEKDRKGTLEAGKLADLVVLSADPLSIDPMGIQDIQVMETIKEGETVYSGKV